MAEVVVKDIRKKYGAVEAVKGLSFDVNDGEILAILGPSGAGKTSTLKVIAGVIPLDGGEIYIAGRLVNGVPTPQRDVAMIFESYALYPHFTVYENLAFPLRAPGRKFSKTEIDQRVRWAADLLRIPELLERKPRELSSGQKQRVSVGRALVRKPACYLMDEPISHLDAKLRHAMRAELKKIMEETLHTSTIYVTHDYTEAMALANKAIVIDKGEMQQFATPDDIFNRPANQFVAHVVGSPPINFLDCHVASEDGELYLAADDGSFRLAVVDRFKAPLAARSDPSVKIGVRPIDISVSAQSDDHFHIPAEVYIFEPLGAKGILTAQVGGKIVQIVTEHDLHVQIGDRVWLAFDPAQIHVFDSATTRNVLLS